MVEMDLDILCEEIEDGFVYCPIDGKKFMPRNDLESIISQENVRSVLGIKDGVRVKAGLAKPSELPYKITSQARTVFAALVVMEKVAAIGGVLEEGLTDADLPLRPDPDASHDAFLSQDGSKTFHLVGWSRQTSKRFIRETQWGYVSPILDTTGQHIQMDTECALPFTESEHIGSGAAGVVHRARLHPAHQRGFETETTNLQVAVKEFHKKSEFDKENETLQQIKALKHRHIIRHFISIEKGLGNRHEWKGYIVFPWAAGGNLEDFWMASDQKPSQKLVLWSIQQMHGLTTALQMLHELFQCRHGDLKPGNILCVEENGQTILKLADFGISKIHHAQTIHRKIATSTAHLTPSYQGPEVEFEKADAMDPKPRSRKYDIWSLGCVFLEFAVWISYGSKGIKDFFEARGSGAGSTSSTAPLYSVTNKATKSAIVHELATWTIKKLENNPLCKGDTALAALLNLISNQMLLPEVERRPSAANVCKQLEHILKEASIRPSYLLNTHAEPVVPKLDFDDFHQNYNAGR